MTQDVQLDTLEAKGLIRLATVRPELEYLFRHALVQDAAYGSLLKQERRELHDRVGAALEELYPDRREELAPVLAMHFEQAGEREKAIGYYVSGAQHALRQYAIQEAYEGFERAGVLIHEEQAEAAATDLSAEERDRRRRRHIEVELGRADAGYSFRAPEEAFATLERILPEAEDLGDPELAARLHTLIALGRLQNGEATTAPEVKRSLDRITEIGDAIGDPSLRAMPAALVGLSQVFTGPIRDGVAALEASLPLLEDRQQSIGAAFARGGLAIGYAILGEFEKASAAAAKASEIAGRADLIAQLDALIAESFVHSLKGDLDAAVPIAEQCVKQSEETGASACMVVSSWILGDAFLRQGRFVEARDVLKRGSDVSLIVDRKVWRPTLLAWFGRAAAATGGDGERWDEALETARSIGNRAGEAMILAKRAEAVAIRDGADAARPYAEAAIALFEELGARPYLARSLNAWGLALRTAGRADEADVVLRRALALFEALGIEGEASAIRTLLALGDTKLAFD